MLPSSGVRRRSPRVLPNATKNIYNVVAYPCRNEMLAKVAVNYQKIWSWKYMRYYFVNLRTEGKRTQWSYPPAVNKHNESIILTPRSYFNTHKTNDSADLEYIHSTVRHEREAREAAEKVARRQQRALLDQGQRGDSDAEDYDNYQGAEGDELLEMLRVRKEKKRQKALLIKSEGHRGDGKGDDDDDTARIEGEAEEKDKKHVEDVKGEEDSEKVDSSLALVAVGGGAAATVGLNRYRIQKQIKEQRIKQKKRILNLSLVAAARKLAEEKLVGKGGLTREQASKKLQGSCRIWLARRELAARAEGLWVLVRPDQSKGNTKAGKKPRPYYFNMRTRETSWIKPKAFGLKQPKEITMNECKKKLKRWFFAGNNVVKRMEMTYPVSHKYLTDTAATKIQKIGRSFLARDEARAVTWATWEEEIDEDTGEPFYRHVLDSYNTKWERPWTPRDTLTRMRAEKKKKKEKRAP